MTMTLDNTSTITEDALPLLNEAAYERMYDQSRAEIVRLQALLEATRAARSPSRNQSVKPIILAEQFKAQAGAAAFLQMTRDEKLRGIGADPATTSDAGILKVFGRGCDPQVGQDLMRSSPQR
jgi:hypothetical protein